VTAKVLRSSDDIRHARTELKARGLSALSPCLPLLYALRRIGIRGPIPVGYEIKSWDVLETTRFLEQHVARDAAILDLGAFTSEMPSILHRLGYSRITGIDMNSEVLRMPYADAVRYVAGDFMKSPLPSSHFDAITAISAIEHGYQGDELFKECERLLRPGGYFIASFDYWPLKRDTSAVTMYGMTWRIFSEAEVHELVEVAGNHGFEPIGPLDLTASTHVFTARLPEGHFEYTFAWLVLQKRGDH
jgi:SAM-dependent methyltransferase